MRVLYYTRAALLDVGLQLVRELSKLVELHVLLEVSPEAVRGSVFDLGVPSSSAGESSSALLDVAMAPPLRQYLRDTASFDFVVHHDRRSISPQSWRTTSEAFRRIDRVRPDVLHLDDLNMRLIGPGACFSRAPLVLSVHDPRPHSGEGNWRTTLARAVTFPRVSRFILHNETQKSDFCSRYRLNARRVDVVRLGTYAIYREWALPGVERSDRTVLFFGRLSRYKGLEVLYAAAPQVAAAVPGVRFVVAGRPVGGYQPPLPQCLPNGGTIECVYEHIPNARLAELFQTASLVVCPYVDATQSGVALTAFAFGRPVVATRVGGLPEYVRDGLNGLLVRPGDPEGLAQAMIRIMLEPNLRSSLDRGVHALAEQELTWQRVAAQTVQTYEGAVRA